MKNPKYIATPQGRLAYEKTPGEGVGVLFLGDHECMIKSSHHAEALRDFCAIEGMPFVCLDYIGYGASEGDLKRWQVNLWVENALLVLEEIGKGPWIVVGHGMGGWLMLVIAATQTARVKGLVGVAPGFDISFDDDTGATYFGAENSSFAISVARMEKPIPRLGIASQCLFNRPVRLIHSMSDKRVSWLGSINMVSHIGGEDVRVTLIKDGNHAMNRPDDIALMLNMVREVREVP